MNSLQKQTLVPEGESLETFFVSFETNLLKAQDVTEVELLMKKLQFLGLHYNPFDQPIEDECEQILVQLGLKNHLNNPYLATNILLRLLDKTEERLNNLKQ